RLLDRAQQVRSLRADPRHWIEANLFLRSKDQRMVPFRLWPAQVHWYGQRSRWDVILKARQLGFTSLICALYFADTVLRPNTVSVMVAHDLDSAERIFQIVRLYWERLPEEERQRIGEPRYLNRRELYWSSLNSRFWVGTAGSAASGRGHTVNNLHCSEFAFWPNPEKVLAGLTEAVPLSGRIVIESTPNGMGNPFHDLWVQAKQGENPYRPHFYQWQWDSGYRLPGSPLGELTEEEQQLRQARNLDDDQLRWRREKRRQLRDRFPQEYPENDGHCFLASGRCCFEMAALLAARARIAAEPSPESISHLQARDGESLSVAPAHLLVWRQPEEGRKYVIGADVAEGLSHGDASAACVLDTETGEQVAELHGRIPPGRFARLLDALGRLYQHAELGVEKNNHGHTVLDTLGNTLGYYPLYRHRGYDKSGARSERSGYPTNAQTKPILIDDLAEALAEGFLLVHSTGLVDECLTFVTTDSGSQEAQPGKHDDRVIAAAIAWQVRKRPTPQPNIRFL
ncbi:MAG: hypothetical protein MUQ65_05910, partial [Armatimonadetes bacterium]|nr:hypothetical protein [Armatimonadota bacterium]